MAAITIEVGRGTATGIDPSLTKQLQESVGVVYAPGDPAARKFPGRTVFNNTPIASAAVLDVLMTNNNMLALVGSNLYRSGTAVAAFSSIWSFPAVAHLDGTVLSDVAYIVSGAQASDTAPFGALAFDSSAYRLGLSPTVNSPGASTIAGPGISGTFKYWVTEYDSANAVESAVFDALTVSSAQPVNQKVQITKPATVNASATKWRIYRTIDQGSFPIGWLVAEVAIATATYDDNTADADLVLNDPYRIVSPNGIPESMDVDPQPLALSSIASFQGSLVGTTVGINGDIAYTPALEPHSWPVSYRISFPTTYGGSSRCVRQCGNGLYVAFPSELFRVNYLPDETDSVFSPDIAVEHVANYGTPSARGMCAFTAWGGMPVLFVASLQGPILVAGEAGDPVVDRAVRNINWKSLVQRRLLGTCNVIDNPDEWRIEMYYRDSTTDSGSYKCLHFYYDQARVTREVGSLPEMAWTGPHAVPGPGCVGIGGGSGLDHKAFTAGRNAATGTVYLEDDGTSDAANLIDADGTIQFRLRTPKVYPGGIDSEARADRLFIHKNGAGETSYDCTFNAHRENGSSKPYPNINIAGNTDGVSSNGLNASCVSFDVRVVADGTGTMSPINNITVRIEDQQKKSLKTVTT